MTKGGIVDGKAVNAHTYKRRIIVSPVGYPKCGQYAKHSTKKSVAEIINAS